MATYKKLVKQNYLVLEIGASTIDRTRDLSKLCKKIIGVEYQKKRLPCNHGNIEYTLGDWQKLDKIIKPNTVDLAISSHTLEHIPNDKKAINQLYKVLKPNKYAIITTPNRKRLIRVIIEFFTSERKFPHWEHIREYTELDLEKLIKSTNFKKFTITPVVIGFHFQNIKICFTKVPNILKKYANCWEIILKK